MGEEELREKEKRWNRTVDRLQRQVCDLTRKNQELEEEVKRSGLQIQQAQFGAGRSASATASARGRRTSSVTRARTSTRSQGIADTARAWQARSLASKPSSADSRLQGRPSAESLNTENTNPASNFSHSSKKTVSAHPLARDALLKEEAPTDVREVRSKDGKIEKIYWDDRSEIEFCNGLRKVQHPDGRTQVFFQNGDEKEIHTDGVVVYRYFATKAVQTTLTDGCELYEFQDGQFERHHPDGSKEIHFPNGTSKRIKPSGSEEVTFPDGTVRQS